MTDVTPEPTQVEVVGYTLNEAIDDLEDRLTKVEKRNQILTVGVIGVGLGMFVVGRTMMVILKQVQTIGNVLNSQVPTQLIEEAQRMAEAAANAPTPQHIPDPMPEPMPTPPSTPVVRDVDIPTPINDLIASRAPVGPVNDPGAQELPDEIKNQLAGLDLTGHKSEDAPNTTLS